MRNVREMIDFINAHPNYKFCPYLADKDSIAWNKSTSRGYMNQVIPGFIYLPFNIENGNNEELIKFYDLCINSERIVAINQTQPHKSNPILKDLFPAGPVNIDTLSKHEGGRLKPFSLNGTAFCSWFIDEVNTFKDKTVIILGVGGAGEPIAREIMNYNPRSLHLVDIRDRNALARELGAHAMSYQSINEVSIKNNEKLVFIYTAGKEFNEGLEACNDFLFEHKGANHIFVDLRPHLSLSTVDNAKHLGWRGYTGNGMNARNDYALLIMISRSMEITTPPFEVFKSAVDDNS